ncbi:DUF3040 domain-containing protein [Enemella sp. A6]|uniref:DUF3040 domain-containing protein n=1 Tax=Enemella sp. A6 TaxID=3440152 RepID=UPI003EB7A556
MPLSEEEKRLLAQMEAALAADDPKLAENLRGTTRRKVSRRTAGLAGIGFFVGLAALIGGLQIHPVVSIIGFLLMLAGAVVAISAWRNVDPTAVTAPDEPRPARSPGGAGEDSFMDRMEERWRRRQDPDGF